MAVMGVRVNSGGDWGLDTKTGEMLAKAIWGDPEREMKLALARSDLENDTYLRRQYDANIDRLNAQAELDKYKLSGMQGAEDEIARILAARDTPAAAPVEVRTPQPDVAIPVPTPRPDYRMEQPVPVE